jgi:hypothetical protein
MTDQDLPKALLEAVEAELMPLGFKLAPNKKKRSGPQYYKPHSPMSVSAACVRSVDKQRTERYHLMVNYQMPGFRISPSVGVRFEEVEKILHRTSGYERAQQKESTTVGIDLWRVFGRDQYQVTLKDEADLATATSRIVAIFCEKTEPYFAQFSTLAAVDSAINDQPSADCVHRDSTSLRCSTGLIVAKLVGRQDYDQLASIYLDIVRNKASHELPKFELLLNNLAKRGV